MNYLSLIFCTPHACQLQDPSLAEGVPPGLQNCNLIIPVALSIIAIVGYATCMYGLTSSIPTELSYASWCLTAASLLGLIIFTVRPTLSLRCSSFCKENGLGEAGKSSTTSEKQRSSKECQDLSQFKNIPDELLLEVFKRLDLSELAIASRVSKRWYRITSDDQIWKPVCEKQGFEPVPLSESAWHDVFQSSKSFIQNVSNIEPKKQVFDFKEPVEALLVTAKKIYLCFSNKIEEWDLELKNCTATMPFYYTFYQGKRPNKVINCRLKLVNEELYALGWDDGFYKIAAPSWNIKTHNQIRDIFFGQPSEDGFFKNRLLRYEMPLEFHNHFAYAGIYNGNIFVWDLHLNYRTYSDDERDLPRLEKDIELIKKQQMPEERRKELIELCEDTKKSYEKNTQHSTLKGHTASVECLQYADNYLFTASRDGTIKKWNLANNECAWTIQSGFEGIDSLIVKGDYIACGESGKVHVFDSQTHELFFSIETPIQSPSLYNYYNFFLFGNCLIHSISLAKTMDSKSFIDTTIDFYDLVNQKKLNSLTHTNEHFCWDPSWKHLKSFQVVGNKLFCCGNSQMIVWDFSKDPNL